MSTTRHVLTAERESELAYRWHDHQDLHAAHELILAHLRFVVFIARGYEGYGLALDDLIQEGNIGLMKAVKRFDPNMGVRLVTFAVHWIKSEIYEFIIRNWRIVKVATTKAQRKLFFNLRKMKNRLGWFSQAEVDGVAEILGVKRDEVLEMEQRLNAHDAVYDGYDYDDATRRPAALMHFLEDKGADPALLLSNSTHAESNKEKLLAAFETLNTRSKDIIQQRWFNEKRVSRTKLARKYNISIERVRQLEQQAMDNMRNHIKINHIASLTSND